MTQVPLSAQDMEQRIVRYGDLVPCKTAFIDAHTPGSDQKENFTIIGGGVSESPDQHVHIKETPGFNIGAAGQPPNCFNSLHTHRTAEAFFVLKGRWRFFWGRHGDTGEVILEEGDIFNIPTAVFRGFENIGTDYGMIMSILGGDDAGGGVIWAPEVIQRANDHGLILAESGRLYDSAKGEILPDGVSPMPLMTEEELAELADPAVSEIVPRFVARYQDMMALAAGQPANVISENGLIKDRPGFAIDFIKRGSIAETQYTSERHEILMVMRGHWQLSWEGGNATLAPGDVCAVPPQLAHSLKPAMTGEASLFRVSNTDDPAGPTTWV
ncbi:cupin domain-containing protein [Leucothrix mucor]|uniref:cupin domain-containing protein n=1 Tax=Leucothrix mucor TaxID=45248 RepID=UPI0003B6DB72|nr:cupin domain-containing protein [Leucothrix mucor]